MSGEGVGEMGLGVAGDGVCEVGGRTDAVELGERGAEDSGANWYRGTSQDEGAQGMEDRAASGGVLGREGLRLPRPAPIPSRPSRG